MDYTITFSFNGSSSVEISTDSSNNIELLLDVSDDIELTDLYPTITVNQSQISAEFK